MWMYREDDRQNRISNGFPLPPGAVTRTLAYTYNNNIPNENTSLFLLFFFSLSLLRKTDFRSRRILISARSSRCDWRWGGVGKLLWKTVFIYKWLLRKNPFYTPVDDSSPAGGGLTNPRLLMYVRACLPDLERRRSRKSKHAEYCCRRKYENRTYVHVARIGKTFSVRTSRFNICTGGRVRKFIISSRFPSDGGKRPGRAPDRKARTQINLKRFLLIFIFFFLSLSHALYPVSSSGFHLYHAAASV